MPRVNILDSYLNTIPSAQNAIDIFKGEWSSQFPAPFDVLKAGNIPLFQDARMAWAMYQMGGVLGQNVLELGPLEAGHSYMLEQAGAGLITAIESNTRAYVKCLLVKEIMNLARTRFLCGDFIPYLEETRQQFDLIVASGVLYHMKDPLRLLELLAAHTNRLYLWTHYFDRTILSRKKGFTARFREQELVEVGGRSIAIHRHDYLAMLDEKTYCGGSAEYSKWFTREGLMHALNILGFNEVQVSFDSPDHHNGPALSILAIRK
jgi:hypothetical protein